MQSQNAYSRYITLSITLLMALFALPSYAALNGYASLSSGGNPIEGDVAQAGREGTIAVRAFNQTLSLGDKDKEQIVGPLVIMTSQGAHSPVLIQSFLSGAEISGTVEFYTPSPSGEEALTSTVAITGGRVIGVEQEMFNNLIPSQMAIPVLDKITIEADSITWTHEPTGNTATVSNN